MPFANGLKRWKQTSSKLLERLPKKSSLEIYNANKACSYMHRQSNSPVQLQTYQNQSDLKVFLRNLASQIARFDTYLPTGQIVL